MFRRGGSTNRNPDSGIVSGFKRGGTIPKRGLVDSPGGYSGEEYAELVQKYMQAPVEEEGMTTSDWLRIAASGANIMGAPSTGRSDVWGALQAAGPSLGELGTGLADSRDARRASYLTRKNAYDAALAGAAVTGLSDEKKYAHEKAQLGSQLTSAEDIVGAQIESAGDIAAAQIASSEKMSQWQIDHNVSQAALDRAFEYSQLNTTQTFQRAEQQREFENAVKLLIKDKELNPYEFEKQYIIGEGANLIEIMSTADKDSAEYKKAKQEFLLGLHGETVRSNTEEKASLLTNQTFNDFVADLADGVITSGDQEDPDSDFYGLTDLEVATKIMNGLFSEVFIEFYIPEGNARGGTPIRRKFALGGTDSFGESYREKEAVNVPEPGDENIEFSFQELRKRLPPEVSDAVINLILNSEEAMIDFAKLQTQEDVSIFNQKYNSDLQIPQQVA